MNSLCSIKYYLILYWMYVFPEYWKEEKRLSNKFIFQKNAEKKQQKTKKTLRPSTAQIRHRKLYKRWHLSSHKYFQRGNLKRKNSSEMQEVPHVLTSEPIKQVSLPSSYLLFIYSILLGISSIRLLSKGKRTTSPWRTMENIQYALKNCSSRQIR